MDIDINSLTFGQIKEIAARVNPPAPAPAPASVDAFPWKIGTIYLIRTVTMTDTGRLVAITANELLLEDAAWIADTGRFSDAVEKAEFGEVEPFPDGTVIIGRGGIIDAVPISQVQRSRK